MSNLRLRYFCHNEWCYIDLYDHNTAIKFKEYENKKTSGFYRFTELVTKKGVDIYEGDFISLFKETFKVIFKEGHFFLKGINKTSFNIKAFWLTPAFKYFKIIGNSIENPELMKK